MKPTLFVLKSHQRIDCEDIEDIVGVFSTLAGAMVVATAHEQECRDTRSYSNYPSYGIEEFRLDEWATYLTVPERKVFSKPLATYARTASGEWDRTAQRPDGTWDMQRVG